MSLQIIVTPDARMGIFRIVFLILLGKLVVSSNTRFVSRSTTQEFCTAASVAIGRGGQQLKALEEDDELESSIVTKVSSQRKNTDLQDEFANETFVESPYTKRNERYKRFFNRIAAASANLLRREEDARLDDETEEASTIDLRGITPQSDLRRPGRHVHIVTTACLPWMTGTAVNPLLRAAYLHERLEAINHNITKNEGKTSWVTLVVPWLELPEDQEQVYGQIFNSTAEQEAYVRSWLLNQANMPNAAKNLNIVFYNARYHAGLGSVFAMGDIIGQLPPDELDVCILEEPEHVNWFRAPGEGWTKRYNYVLGIIHTNYDQYATQHYSGLWTAPAIRLMSSAMVRAYCHKVIKLSDVLQPFAPEREITMNVHGVRKEFIQTGKVNWSNQTGFDGETNRSGGEVYFIGKLLWAKGLNLLLEYEEFYKQMTGSYFPVDIYGSGPDQDEITRAFFGRWPQDQKQKDDFTQRRRNVLVKVFTWLNRRSRLRPKVSKEEVYRDFFEVLEALPSKAKESVTQLPSKVRIRMEQFSDEKTLSKKSVGNMSTKLRKAIDKLIKDISRAGFKLDSSSIPQSFYELRRQPIPARFPGRVDHASLKKSHKIFVNPSLSEVLTTTTFEALAMGKFAIIPVHPSNTFFQRFPNALMYSTPFEFLANLQWALTHDPIPLTDEMAEAFTWEAATDRLFAAAAITHEEARGRENLGRTRMDERIEWFHNQLGKGTKGDVLRKVFGAGPVSEQVKYVKSKTRNDDSDQETLEEDDDDEEEGLLSRKFSNSALVKAIRQATVITISARRPIV